MTSRKLAKESVQPPPDVRLYLPKTEIPPIVPALASTCPIPNARSRILDRYQSEDGRSRPTYRVLITRPLSEEAQPSSTVPEPENDARSGTPREEELEVDVSAILQYVSPAELERYENAQFRIEREVELVAQRAEEEKVKQLRLHQLSKTVLKTLSGRGRPLGRPSRGRGRGRGRPAGIRNLSDATPRESDEVLDSEEEEAMEGALARGMHPADVVKRGRGRPRKHVEVLTRPLADSGEEESEEEVEEESHPSPNLMKSSFVASSALHSTAPERFEGEIAETEDEDEDSASSASRQLHDEIAKPVHYLHDDPSSSEDESSPHHSKRVRTTESPPPLSNFARRMSSATREPSLPSKLDIMAGASNNDDAMDLVEDEEEQAGEENEEEFAVEAILDHQDIDDVRYYLVKWEGYAEAQDWLAEDDLAGADDMLKKYKKKARRQERARERLLEG